MDWISPFCESLYPSCERLYKFWRYWLVTEEFASFWSSLLSGIIALALGIPIGLRLNRATVQYSERLREKEEKRKLHRALEIIKSTLEKNSSALSMSIKSLGEDKAYFETFLEVAVWDAVKPEIVQYLHDSTLKARLAQHFAELNEAVRLHQLYFDYSAGMLATLTTQADIRVALFEHLTAKASHLFEESRAIQAEIELFNQPKSSFWARFRKPYKRPAKRLSN